MNREEQEIKIFEALDSCDINEITLGEIAENIMEVIPPSSIEQVKEFHKTMGLEYSDTPVPTVPSEEICKLRFNLIFEELTELAEAMGIVKHSQSIMLDYVNRTIVTTSDKVKVLDALLDLRYVVDGTVVSCQMEDIHDEAFEEVHRSNMSKACVDMDHAHSIIAKLPTNFKYKAITNLGKVIIRREDGKIIKPETYKKAELKQFF